MLSPRVRVSLAMRLRRSSEGDGDASSSGYVGDRAAGKNGDSGTRVSVGAMGTVLTRSVSGAGFSIERRPLELCGVETMSMLGRRDSGSARDDSDEFVDDDE
jgi:hypothetical protein